MLVCGVSLHGFRITVEPKNGIPMGPISGPISKIPTFSKPTNTFADKHIENNRKRNRTKEERDKLVRTQVDS